MTELTEPPRTELCAPPRGEAGARQHATAARDRDPPGAERRSTSLRASRHGQTRGDSTRSRHKRPAPTGPPGRTVITVKLICQNLRNDQKVSDRGRARGGRQGRAWRGFDERKRGSARASSSSACARRACSSSASSKLGENSRWRALEAVLKSAGLAGALEGQLGTWEATLGLFSRETQQSRSVTGSRSHASVWRAGALEWLQGIATGESIKDRQRQNASSSSMSSHFSSLK